MQTTFTNIPVLQDEEQIRFYIKDLGKEDCTIPVKFDDYNDLGNIIVSLMKVCKYAMHYKDDNKIPETELSYQSVSNCIGIAIQLIPQVELEFLSTIMEEFNELKNTADHGNATDI